MLDPKLEAYKIINEKINKEVDEFYQINLFFSAAQTVGIFGYFAVANNKLIIVPVVALLIISILWADINKKALGWRNHWLDEAKELEKQNVLEEIRLWEKTEREIHLQGVWRSISFLPEIFKTVWIIFIVVYFLNFCLKNTF